MPPMASPKAPARSRDAPRRARAAGLQRRKRELVRDEIARAAWDLFGSQGYEAVTVDEIARATGVSRRTFFRYFSSKEDVVVGTSDALAEAVLAAFARRPPHEAPLVAIQRAIRPVVVSHLAEADQARAIIRLLRESRTLRRAMLERHARMEERLAALLARKLGTDPRRDPTPALLAFLTRALVDTAFNVWFDQSRRDPGAMLDDAVRRRAGARTPRKSRA
jgi:AcrR family transcriptional regulator